MKTLLASSPVALVVNSLAALLLAGALALAGMNAAGAAQTIPSAADVAAAPDLRSLNRQVTAQYQAARAECRPLARAERRDCLREARAVRQEARAEVHRLHPLSAVQTQSAEVMATGIAPTTGGPSPAPAAVPVVE